MASITTFDTGTGSWTLLDEDGGSAVTFTSFLDLDVSAEGEALSYPVEEGGFVNYNKVTSPLQIKVKLAVQGTDSDFEDVLSTLDDYKADAVKLSVSTPAWLYESMTLETYSYKRQYDSGAGLLVVDLTLVEVREVSSQTTQVTVKSTATSTSSDVSSPKNATSASNVNTGKTQTQTVSDTSTERDSSKLYNMLNKKQEG